PEAEAGEGEEPEDAEAESSDEPAAEGGARRRRRRRRRGEDNGDAEDDPSIEVVARVREPRRNRSVSDEVTGIEGSTRMEAKKQRRREGRAAGRRRTAILSEAEFLARRESVDRTMLIRQAEDYSQIAVLEDGILVEHYVDRASATSMIGNIYLGRIQNVLPSMEAAFIDIGRGRNAVLYAGEVDWASYGVTGQDKKVEKVFKSGQTVLVQVTKDPVGAKGARLTSHISIPGRYVVYSPGGQLSGISRKLPENERTRLKSILDELIGPDASVIIRTAAEGTSEEELVRDVNRLKAQWEVIDKKASAGHAPSLLYAEPDLTVRIVRDLFTEDFAALIVDGDDTWDTVEAYVGHVAPHLADRLQRWDRAASGDIFDVHRVHEQVAKALERKVFLPSGGSLIIDRTEAMTVIDVNTGRFTGTSGNLEATVTSNNLEAAEEIVRQLRLRDIGGIIVIDFIDMVLPSNRELLLRRLVECLGRDRTRHQVAEVTSLGLVQMTRKKIGTGLAEAFTVPCETCKGRGYHTHDVPVASQAPADGGDREAKRGSRGGQSQSRQRPAKVRKPAPELAAVVAATLAHPVTPQLAHLEHHEPEVAAETDVVVDELPFPVPVTVVEAEPEPVPVELELATLPEIVDAPETSPSSPDVDLPVEPVEAAEGV
ncbi:MAG: Rne/Rng family ribonuclease, partial [Propionicimonas sp.]|nr:Rne/Rng family ribonuclease [Propionicimonas sp.]